MFLRMISFFFISYFTDKCLIPVTHMAKRFPEHYGFSKESAQHKQFPFTCHRKNNTWGIFLLFTSSDLLEASMTRGLGGGGMLVYLWFTISTVPYCSIHSFPIITLCTQQVGFVHVQISLCLQRNKILEGTTRRQKHKQMFDHPKLVEFQKGSMCDLKGKVCFRRLEICPGNGRPLSGCVPMLSP